MQQQAFIEGVEDVVRRLDSLHPKKRRAAYRRIVRVGSRALREAIQSNVGRGSRGKKVFRKSGRRIFYPAGALRDLWKVRVRHFSDFGLEGAVYTKVPYALAVEWGHINVITGRHISGKGEVRRAFDSNMNATFNLVVDEISKEWTRIAKRR